MRFGFIGKHTVCIEFSKNCKQGRAQIIFSIKA